MCHSLQYLKSLESEVSESTPLSLFSSCCLDHGGLCLKRVGVWWFQTLAHILWNFLVGHLGGTTWTFIPQWGFASLLSALLPLPTWSILVHKVWLWFLWTYAITSVQAARLHVGQLAVTSQGRHFPFLGAESKLYHASCVIVPFCTENRFLVHPNTEGVVLGAPDLCRNLPLDYMQVKTETWGLWIS